MHRLYNCLHLSLPRNVQSHLAQVYTTLATMSLVAAVGAYVHVYGLFLFGGGFISFLLSGACLFGINMLPASNEANKTMRYGLLYAFAAFQGLSLGPIVEQALHVSPHGGTLVSACIFTALIFGSFSLSALFSNRRSLIYLLGICGSATTVLFWASIVNSLPFFRSNTVFTLELYAGLLVFSGYIIADTQLIIERALRTKTLDVVGNSAQLFVDLVAVFVRVLLILIKSQEKKQKEEESRRRRRK